MAGDNSILSLNDDRARGRPCDGRGDPKTSAGAAIAQARTRAGLSQAQLAKSLNRSQSYIAKIELNQRGVEVREFLWIIQRMGADPLPLLSQMLLYGNFRDLQHRPKREVRYEVDDCEIDDDQDDDDTVLGHLRFDQKGAV